MPTQQILEYIVIVGSTIATLYAGIVFLYKKLIKPKIIIPFQESLNKINKIDEIHEKLGPNGGSSIYDRIVKIDNKLSFSDTRGKLLISSLNIGELHSDTFGKCIFINRAACRFLNRTEEEFLGNNWINAVWDIHKDSVLEEWNQAVKSQRQFELNFSLKSSDNKEIPIVMVATPTLDNNNNILGWVSILQRKIQ